MTDPSKTNQELLEEISALKQKIKDLEQFKTAEEALRESEEQYRLVFNSGVDAIFIHDEKERILAVNQQACEQLGYTHAELMSMTINQVDSPAEVQHIPERIARLMKQGHITFETVHQCKDGSRIPHEVNAQRITWGGQPAVMSICSDITDRKRAEENLRKSKDLLLEMTTQVPGVVYQFYARPSGEMGFYYVSDRSEQILGINPNLEGYFERVTAAVKPEYREGFLKSIEKAVKEVSEWHYEGMLQKPSGEIIWFSGNSTPSPRENEMVFNGIVSDITERKMAEEALKESEQRYSTLSEASYEGILIHDHGNTLDANLHFIEMFGYTLEDLKRMSAYDLIVPEYQTIMLDKIAHGDTGPYEVRARRKDGSTFIEEIQVREMCYQGRQVRVAVCRDITERKRAEEALRESEERFRQLSDITMEGIVIHHNGVVLDANRAFSAMFGYELSEVTGKNTPSFAAPESLEIIRNNILSDYQKPYKAIGMRKDGTRFPLEIVGKPASYSGRMCRVSTIRDITEHERAEEALREAQDTLRTIIDNTPEALFLMDSEGNIIAANKALADRFGTTVQHLMGTSIFSVISEDVIASRRTLLDKLVSTGQPLSNSDSNAGRYLENYFHPILNAKGRVEKIAVLSRDITERKRLEDERRELEERLQRSEKMEALGTLAGGVAHDLNNTLGILVGYSEMVLDTIDKSNPIRSDVVNIMQGGERSAAIVQDLLTLARRGVKTEKVVNLNTIVLDYQETQEFKHLCFIHPRLRIKTNLADDLLNIKGSPAHLIKTITNLISNAAESMTTGGTLTITTCNQYLDRPVQGYDNIHEGDYVVLSVSDEGEGINPTDLKRIFEPFYTKKIMGRSGTGLGLAVVWSTVKDHNGYIDVTSVPGQGTNFTLYIPVTREEMADDETVPIEKYMGKGESILVVDDVQGQRDLAARMLIKLNYSVYTVSSGEEAVEYLKDHNTDLVILDMIMDPGMDGQDTYRRILEINPTQKAIIVSGFSESDRVHDAQALGAGGYVKKPYVIEKLGLAVRKELDKKQVKSDSLQFDDFGLE